MSTDAASAPVPKPVTLPAQPAKIADHDQEEPALGQIECAKPAFLHSPPDSNNAHKSEASDSELSDLDEEAVDPSATAKEDEAPVEDDIGEILPDHWSGTVPVFKPTMHQFKDFKLFMTKVDHYGMKSGIVKIIPPSEWKESLPRLDDLVKQIRVREPIKQDIMGSNGTYRQVNILHQRSYNLPQWRQLCDQSEHQPPARRGERRANVEKPKPRSAARPRAEAKSTLSGSKKKGRGRPRRGKAKGKNQNEEDDDQEDEKRPMTPISPKPDPDVEVKREELVNSVGDPGMDVDEEEEEEEPRALGRMGRMGGARPAKPKTQSVSARRKYSKREGSAMVDEKAFEDFDYQMDVSDYTPERCEELERIYWKTLTYAPPLYGADLMGTLFHESTEIWNLNKLPNLLDVLGTKVPGVNTAYLYLGMWKATFAWHLEDVDLYSINYLHFGAPKQWYSISQADARRFEAAMKNIWPTDAKACDQFLRHKGFLISPSHLKQHYNITVNKCVSYPGEFVVTYPYGYHSGYNLGYNCAEAVNFALDSWLPMGKIAKRCECAQAQDSVWVDVYDIERKLRGEPTPEYEETEDEEDDEDEDEDEDDATGLPSPPDSNGVIKPARKRKRATGDKDGERKVKKIRLKVKTRAEPICCLCPNDIPGAEILPTDDGRKAHRMCALYLPETYIDTVEDKEVIANVAHISKERLDLKCLYCRSKKGACFQCSQKKCARAYHATCAAAAGVFVEEAEVPVFGEDGTEYKEQAFEFSCRFHRTKRDRKYDGDALEDDVRIRDGAAALKKGEICQLQYFKGDIFAGVVVENRSDEQTLLLDIIPNGDRLEVEWKWLLLPDPSDYHLPKASGKAIPMPSSQKAKDKLNAKRPADEIPRKDAPFVEGYTWAEFHPCAECANPNQARVDLAKDNQIWHYLGKSSTEAKAQYSEDPVKELHNPKSNFLDTIPKPPKPVSANTTHRRVSNIIPPQPSPVAAPGPAVQNGPRSEKPYVYKPRKPVENHYASTGSFTTQKFTPTASPSPSPMGQQLHFGSDPRYPAASPPFVQQMFTPDVHQQYVPRANPAGQGYHQSTNAMSRVSPYSTPGPQPAGGVRPTQQTWVTPSQSPKPQLPHGGSHGSGQQTHRRYSAAPTPSVAMKYAFFQVHHNRDSKTYRTPYAPGGGFTNGYEGNLRAHLMQTSPEAFFKNRQGPIQGGATTTNPPARPQAPGYGGPYFNTLTNTMPQGSIGMYGVKTTAPSYLSPTQQASQESARPRYSASMSPSPVANGAQLAPNGQGNAWHTQQSQSTPLHPAIRPQYGAWTNNPRHSAQSPSQPAQQQFPQPPLQQSTPAQLAASATQPPLNQAKPQAAPKSSAPKVQYKIPEKQTPVPLPAKYLAAMGKLPSAATPSKTGSQKPETKSQDVSPSQTSSPAKDFARGTPATNSQNHSSQVNATSQPGATSNGSMTQQAPGVSQTPVPVPHTSTPTSNSRMPFTNQSLTTAFPRQPVQLNQPPHDHVRVFTTPSDHQHFSGSVRQPPSEHHTLNPAEILAQIATQPRMNPPTPTTPSHQSMPSPAPQTIGVPPYQNHGSSWGITQQARQQPAVYQPQGYAPPPGQYADPVQQQQHHHHHHQTQYQHHHHHQQYQSQQHHQPNQPVPMQSTTPHYEAPRAPEGEVPLPEVPADSTALVERMMQNLRRAAFQG